MFEIGETCVYPIYGLAQVVDIEEKNISGKSNKFYVLQILDSDMRVMVPVEKSDNVGLRKLISKDEVQDIYDIFKEQWHIDIETRNRKYSVLAETIRTGSLYDAAEAYRNLYCLSLTETLSFGERRMLDIVKNLVIQELSMVCGIKPQEIESKVQQLMNK